MQSHTDLTASTPKNNTKGIPRAFRARKWLKIKRPAEKLLILEIKHVRARARKWLKIKRPAEKLLILEIKYVQRARIFSSNSPFEKYVWKCT